MPNNSHDPSNSIIFLTNRVSRLLSNEVARRSQIRHLGVSPQHIGVLVDLWVKDGVRQQDLAISIIKDKGTIARALTKLEQCNLLIRVPDEQDKRNKRIYLTHKGKELKGLLVPQAKEVVAEVLEDINEEDINTCKRVLAKMYEKLHK